MNSAIKAIEVSENRKIGRVSATYATQATCPSSCKLRENGCYAESGLVAFITRKLNRSEDSAAPVEELAMAEAVAIAGLTGEHPLRMHVVGDATTDGAARLLSSAAEYHTNKHNQPVWTYTHAWRDVERSSWGKVSVFASCESTEDAKLAMSRGYAAALVVDSHAQDKAYGVDGLKLVPCPQQTGRSASCVDCGLCMRADSMLKMGSVIAFEVHGQQAARAKSALIQIEVIK